MPKSYNSFYRSWVSLLVGTSGTIVGASLFNVLSDIKGYIFKSQEMLVLTLLAVYFTFVSFSSVLYIFVNVATHGFLLLGLIGNTVLAALIPTICFLNNDVAGAVLLCVAAALLGMSISLTLSSSLGLSSNGNEMSIGSIAAGIGLSGCLAFGVWLTAIRGIFTKASRDSVRFNVLILFMFCFVLGVATIVQYVSIARRHLCSLWCNSEVENAEIDRESATLIRIQPDMDSASDSDKLKKKLSHSTVDCSSQTSAPPQPIYSNSETTLPAVQNWAWYCGVMRQCAAMLVLRVLIFLESYMCFPYISPNCWKQSRFYVHLLTGIFQLSDFPGRYFPIVFPKMMLNEKQLFYGCFFRLFIIVPIYLTAIFYNVSPFNALPLQIIELMFIAFTNGWFSSCSTVLLPARVKGVEEKKAASKIGISLAFIGISVAMWTSLGLRELISRSRA